MSKLNDWYNKGTRVTTKRSPKIDALLDIDKNVTLDEMLSITNNLKSL